MIIEEQQQGSSPRLHGFRMPFAAWLILALTASLSLLWSAHKILGQDEIFSLQTDRVKSLAEVLRIQLLYPISLEPPPYHVFSHAAMQLFGANAFALRLPALVGFLAMQVCLFFFVRNLAGERAGLIAMAFPALTSTLYFSAEGRPYGVLLGCYAGVALCWQIAARRGDAATPERGRWLPLLGLVLTLALTLNVHFYGILLLVAVCGAELLREVMRHRAGRAFDWPMLGAIALAMASLGLALPFVKSSSEFKKHYYAGAISVHMLTQPYRQMLIDYTHFAKQVQTLLMVIIVIGGALLVWGCWRALASRQVNLPAAEGAFLGLLLLMPVFAFVLGKVATHALEVRHSIGAIVAICALLGIALAPALRRTRVFVAVLGSMLVLIVVVNALRIRRSELERRATLAHLSLTDTQAERVAHSADRNLYFQNLGEWEVASLYEPDPALRQRLVLVYSRTEEMDRQHHDTMYLTAIHTQRFDPAPIVSYDALRKMSGEHTFVLFHSGWDWTDAAFAQQASQVTPLGSAFGGDLVQLQFRP
jgi:hypothetical protein